ncbi:MAG: D-alanyl-D-alanine carboxypeptidase [Pseudomonadota bacterium]|nr:D-alanyl-D-alanine carboxypeptidase [Pseudomonadota bacterium]
MYKLFKQVLAVLLTMALISSCSLGASSPSNNNETKAIQDFTNNFISNYAESDGFTAISVTAQCHGFNGSNPVTVYSGTMGRDTLQVIQTNSLWQIGSNTKSFTSIVLLQLESEYHNFSINDDLSKWFPEYSYWEDPLTHGPTIQQLMNMTSGIPDDMNSAFFAWYIPNTYTYLPPENMIGFAPQSLNYTPCNNWNYSNTNYQILSLLIGRVTGKDYHGQDSAQVEITNRIINKLNLRNTYYVNNLPTQFVPSNRLVNGYLNAAESTEFSTFSLSYAAGSGNIISTTDDINTYYHALFQSNTLLSAAQFQELSSWVQDGGGQNPGQSISSPAMASNGNAYGLGVGAEKIILTPEQSVNYPNLAGNINNYNFVNYYSGTTLGFSFYYIYNPTTNEYVVIGINSASVSQGNGDILVLVYDILNYLDGKCN